MKTLILYATKHGAVRKIAEMIAERLPGSTVCDVNSGTIPNLSEYDSVVLGGSLMAGQISKTLKEYAVQHSAELKKLRLGLFVSGLDESKEADYLANFPAELLAAARAKRFLGGIYDPSKCGFIERMIMKAVAKVSAYTETIDPGRVSLFAKELSE